jgi:Mg2+ and Co2+ transporter CorA
MANYHFTVFESGSARTVRSRREAATLLTEPANLMHLRLIAPEDADWRWLGKTFALPTPALDNARLSLNRAHLGRHRSCLALTLRAWHGPTGKAVDDLEDVTLEVDLFVGKNFLLEIWPTPTDEIALPRSGISSPAMLLQTFLDALIEQCYAPMDALDSEVDQLETAVYAGELPPDLGIALALKKRLLLLRQTVTPLRDLLSQLLRLDRDVLDAEALPYLQGLFDRTLRLTEQIDLHREILSGVMEATMAQTSNRSTSR